MALPITRYESVRRKVEDYTTTVHSLLGFAACVIHDGAARLQGSEFGLGRRMMTSATNRISPNTDITPDLVAQRDSNYGLVAEAKKSLASDRSRWDGTVRQLRKYDDSLTGWWTATERLARSDAVLLISQERSRAFVKVLEEKKKVDASLVGDRSVVVEFNRSDEANPFIFYRREWGSIGEMTLAAKLEEGVKVPLDAVLKSFSTIRFYDSRPPVEMLLELLWTDVFLNMAVGKQRDEELKAIVLDIDVIRLTAELQKAYGSGTLKRDARSVEFPQQTWISEALDELVRLNLALAVEKGSSYRILFRSLKGDVLQKFCDLIGKDVEEIDGEEGVEQPSLFPASGDEERDGD